MAENVIIMVGDGMGWGMARAAVIAQEIEAGNSGTKLEFFYTEGKGEGLSFQELESYNLATTYDTTIANEEGVFSSRWLHHLHIGWSHDGNVLQERSLTAESRGLIAAEPGDPVSTR